MDSNVITKKKADERSSERSLRYEEIYDVSIVELSKWGLIASVVGVIACELWF